MSCGLCWGWGPLLPSWNGIERMLEKKLWLERIMRINRMYKYEEDSGRQCKGDSKNSRAAWEEYDLQPCQPRDAKDCSSDAWQCSNSLDSLLTPRVWKCNNEEIYSADAETR